MDTKNKKNILFISAPTQANKLWSPFVTLQKAGEKINVSIV